MLSTLAIYLLIGGFAGVMAGLLGVGGGLLIVPALILSFSFQGMSEAVIAHLAVGTSLATIVITSIASIKAHHRRGAVRWRDFALLSPGIIFGAWFGAAIASGLPSDTLRMLFGLFALAVSLQMGLDIKPPAHRQLPEAPGMTLAGALIGMVSAIVGIGGGSMTVPFLTWCNIKVREAVATSAACGLPIALAGALGFIVTGWRHEALPDYTTGFVYWPAFSGIVATSMLFAGVGAKLAHSLPTATLKRVFAVFLLAVGLLLLFGAR
jgi:hypothetical protein